ncbi:MAG: serine/threonine protein kinase [Phycisphaerae bacterium]|nr:serine/threonine protein kinase [Phycisphaerae bacterium]
MGVQRPIRADGAAISSSNLIPGDASPAGDTVLSPGVPGRGFEGPPPDSFVGYTILGEIYRGGQGVIYKALHGATKRTVAIKVMKEGPFASTGDQARFDQEIQILGQLNHPSLVTIHETGVAAGCHYFVMDYISGQPLNLHMRGRSYTVRETLKLFIRICEAVNAAHLRGIIHRDLKPGNIRIDEEGNPHVLDFGLAKVTNAEPDAAAMTMTGQFIGSLPWASPEQAEGVVGKIDLRTDVYSLGVILFEMLTDHLPYAVAGSMRDVLDRIMTAEPARPRSLRSDVDDEVETIVLKCLAKERERRYQSAGELARDIDRYLDGEPIEAKRDSLGYMVRKQVRRYRWPVAIVGAFVMVVMGAAIVAVVFAQQARQQRDFAQAAQTYAEQSATRLAAAEAAAVRQRDVAQQALREAERQREMVVHERDRALRAERLAASGLRDAEQQRANARAAAEQAQALSAFLQGMLASLDPSKSLGRQVPVRYILDEATYELEAGALRNQPETEATVRTTLGMTYTALGEYAAAEPHLREALDIRRRLFGTRHADVAASLGNLAVLLRAEGRYDEAEPLFREALATQRALLGEEHPDVIQSLGELASLLWAQRDYRRALPLLDEAIAARHRQRGDNTSGQNAAPAGIGQRTWTVATAERLLRDALELQQAQYGSEHPDVATAMVNLAMLLSDTRDYAGAEPLLRDALAMQRKMLGNDHPVVAATLLELARLLDRCGKHADAATLYREALSIHNQVFGAADEQTLEVVQRLETCLWQAGRYDEADALRDDWSRRLRQQ